VAITVPGSRASLTSMARNPSIRETFTLVTALSPAAGFLAYAVQTGLGLWQAVAATVAVALTQILPGALIWRAVRPRNGWLLEDLMIGFALGTTVAIGAQVVAGLSRLTWLSAAIPLSIAVMMLSISTTRERIMGARWQMLPWWWGPVVGIGALPGLQQLISYFPGHPLVWPAGAWRPHVDVYLHQALASQLLHRGPVGWPTVLGEDLGYHWFTHAWLAQTARVSGLGLDEVLMRFMPAVMPAAVVLAVAVGALRLSGRPIAGAVAAVLTMFGAQASVFGTLTLALPLTPLSPTTALAVPTLVALVVVLAVRWRGEAMPGIFVLVPLLAVVASGIKGSASPLVVAGLALATAGMLLWNRQRLVAVAVDLVAVSAGLVVTMVLVFHGSSAGLTLGATGAAKQTPLAIWLDGLPSFSLQRMAVLVTVVLTMSRAAAMLLLPFDRRERRDPVTWLLIGGVLAGAGAVGAFSHPGHSQYYFAYTAVPLMSMGAALGMVALGRMLGPRAMLRLSGLGLIAGVLLVTLPSRIEGPVAPHAYDRVWDMLGWAGLVIGCVATLGALVVSPARNRLLAGGAAVALTFTAGGVWVAMSALWRAQAPVVSGPVPITAGLATTQAQIDAARWIRDHSHVDDIVMTNRHCTTPRDPFGTCDSRRWLVSAYSERQMLVEGWTATPRATKIAPEGRESITVDYWKPDLLRLNDDFIAQPSAAAAAQLRKLGVRWIYVDHTRPHAKTLEPHAEHRFSTPDADVYELVPPRTRH
jgi:hypothetical protein